MNKVFNLAKVFTLALVLSFGLSYVYAWTAPTSNPPAGNVSAPINTGSTAQTKNGSLTVGGLTSTGDVCITGKCLSTVGGGGSYTDTDTLGTVMNRGNVATQVLNMNGNYISNIGGLYMSFYGTFGSGYLYSPNEGGWNAPSAGKVLTVDSSGAYAIWKAPVGGVTSFNGATGAVTGVTSVNGQTGGPSGAVTVGTGNTVTLYSGQTNGATYGAHTKCSASADTFCANVVTCRTNLASGVWKLTAAASGGCNAPSVTCNVTCID